MGPNGQCRPWVHEWDDESSAYEWEEESWVHEWDDESSAHEWEEEPWAWVDESEERARIRQLEIPIGWEEVQLCVASVEAALARASVS